MREMRSLNGRGDIFSAVTEDKQLLNVNQMQGGPGNNRNTCTNVQSFCRFCGLLWHIYLCMYRNIEFLKIIFNKQNRTCR